MLGSLKTIQSILEILKMFAVPVLDAYSKYCEKDPVVQANWKAVRTKWAGKDNLPTKISDDYNDLRKVAEEDTKKNV